MAFTKKKINTNEKAAVGSEDGQTVIAMIYNYTVDNAHDDPKELAGILKLLKYFDGVIK